MTSQQHSDPVAKRSTSTAFIVACMALLLIICQGILFYLYYQKHSKENTALISQVAALELEVKSVSQDGRRAVQEEVESQLGSFMTRAEERYRTTTIDLIRVRRLVVVDNQGSERIALGTGRSELSGDPNTSIKLTSPSTHNPIILSTTDDVATVSVSKRATVSAEETGQARISLFQDAYVKGARPMLTISTNKDKKAAGIFLFNEAGRVRAGLGLLDRLAFSELYNEDGELMYAAQTNTNAYVTSFIKADPATRAWNAASTFSTLKTFFDIFTK